MQYALQCRRDEMAGKARPRTAQKVVRLLARSQARSLLDKPVQEWHRDSSAQPHSSSLAAHQAEPAQLADWIRGHWASRPCTTSAMSPLGEDASQIHTGSGPQVMAALRDLVIGILKPAGHPSIAAACRYHARDANRVLATAALAGLAAGQPILALGVAAALAALAAVSSLIGRPAVSRGRAG